MSITAENTFGRIRYRMIVIMGLLLAEVLLLAILYQFFAKIECNSLDSYSFCRFLRSMVARALVVFAAFCVLIWARPRPFAIFRDAAQGHRGRWGAWLNLCGFILLLSPLILAAGRDLGPFFSIFAPIWTVGAVAATVGGLRWIAPARAWHELLAQDRYAPLVILGIAALVPDAADWALPLWDWQVITMLTFDAVRVVLALFSTSSYADPAAQIIGVGEFAVHIARQCSGVEGVALVTAFSALYAFVFRDQVRFPHFWIVVLPLAILLSWLLNAVRIAALILIGAHISPSLAVDGFHSYAGWMFFTLLALGIVFAVQATPWLHRDPDAAKIQGPRLRDDPMAAMILPFAAFMLASIISQALFPHPELGYPLRALVLALALWSFRGVYLRLVWRLDPVAILAGIVVGLGWLWLDAQESGGGMELAAALATLSIPVFVFWVILRLIGTTLLVPVVEEMFFRGYILARIGQGGPAFRLLGIVISTVLFAALHGRWFAAGAAGLIFALVMLRRGRVTDAVLAHVVANAIVAAWALATSDFSLI